MAKISLTSLFSNDGVLARGIKGFTSRPSQLELAQAIQEVIENNTSLIAEAGTGTGKTFAYLIPALLSEKKVIISTGTKNLQEQLFYRDLPLLLKTLKKPIKTALLKGRANYLCHHRIAFNETSALFDDRALADDFFYIKENLPRFESGDISEVGSISEEARVWPYVTSTTDNCLGNECTYYKDCFLVKARKKAQSADLIVINHHLFFADCLLKEEGFGDILPASKVVVFDEAHQLPDISSSFFGKRLSSFQLKYLCLDIIREQQLSARDDNELLDKAETLLNNQEDFRHVLGDSGLRRPWHDVSQRAPLKSALICLKEGIVALKNALERCVERSPVFEKAYDRIIELEQVLDDVTDSTQSNVVHWLETFKRGFSLNTTPLSVAEEFKTVLLSDTSYVFTSATLSVNNKITHFADRLGLHDTKTLLFSSPFDFEQQALFYMPRGLQSPGDKNYVKAMLGAIVPLIEAFQGKTFLLFTSHAALNDAAVIVAKLTGYCVLKQGSMTKSQLLEQFRESKKAVLLGTYSFWEGVDVKGPALSLVVIDKLPFESPACPILKARSVAIKRAGGEPFQDYQLPQAVIALKQGLGRLIRDVEDKGVMVVCDPRLSGRAYGEVFFNSLPSVNKTRDKQCVLDFIENIVE